MRIPDAWFKRDTVLFYLNLEILNKEEKKRKERRMIGGQNLGRADLY